VNSGPGREQGGQVVQPVLEQFAQGQGAEKVAGSGEGGGPVPCQDHRPWREDQQRKSRCPQIGTQYRLPSGGAAQDQVHSMGKECEDRKDLGEQGQAHHHSVGEGGSPSGLPHQAQVGDVAEDQQQQPEAVGAPVLGKPDPQG